MNNLPELLKSPKILEKIYDDLAQPSVRKVGKALETVFDLSNTILLPIKLINEKSKANFKKNLDSYKSKIDGLSDDEIVDVPQEIGSPIIDRLVTHTNDEIADLFLNLLTKASSSKTIDEAHPSFIQIIDRLSVDECRIINSLKHRIDIPSIDILGYSKDGKGFITLQKHVTDLLTDVDLIFPNNVSTYIENLLSLGILSYDRTLHKVGDYYSNLLSSLDETIKNYETSGAFSRVQIRKSFFEVTSFGRAFINASTSKS